MCYSRALTRPRWLLRGRFGFCPKISTPVENSVENLVPSGAYAQKHRFVAVFD